MKTLYIRLFSALMLIVLIVSGVTMVTAAPAPAPPAATVSYTADNATAFTNPERGFHNRYEIINDPAVNVYATPNNPAGGLDPDALDRTFARAKGLNNTIIHSYIHLDMFQNTDTLPAALLDNLTSGLAAIRTAGLKIIVRPAYAWGASPAVPEARILGHIAQINAVVTANADVIVALEAGYLGPWGEWHSDQYTNPDSRPAADTRYRVAKAILSSTPVTIPVEIRYPMYIKEIMFLSDTAVPSGTTALTQSERDRIGMHNDCFLYDDYDRGTYGVGGWMGYWPMPEMKQWVYDYITSLPSNRMMGGETCDGSGTNDSGGVNVQNEMSMQNWTEINEDFWVGNINIWKAANLAASGNDPAETAYVRLRRKMGYRLRLVDATFPTSAPAGSNYTFSANLRNDGYAGVIKPRPIYLVLESGANRFNVQMSNVDMRTWVSGAVALSQQSVTLPSNMPAGTYKLALWLPDYYTGLQSRPEYAIRLANTGTWDATKGYNVLSNSITITGGCAPNCPTNTPAPPTNTPTRTNTPLPATNTPVGPTNTPTKTATPVPPTSTNTPVGQASYEAEASGNTLAGGAVVAACGTCSGGNKVGYVGNNSGTLQYNAISVASAGSYTLTMYYLNGDTVARNATISVNGGAGVNVSFPVTGSWTTVGSVNTTISLNAGSSNTIKFSNATGWAPDFDRITLNTSGGPTNTPVPPTATPAKTNTPVGPTATPTKTNTPLPPTATPTRTNTPSGPTATPTKTATPVPPTATPTSGAALTIDSFSDSNKWSVQHLNDLNKSVSWVMDSIYYGSLPPGEIVMNSSPAGQYYQETITQTLVGRTNLVLRLRDWSDTDTENHWNIVLNDGTDHTVSLNTYGNVTGAYTNINIPLNAFGANLANVQYVRLVHKDATYAVILIDTLSAQ